MTRLNPATAALRIALAGLAGAIAGIHLDLWSRHGYRHIPTIGPLFMLNGIAGAVLAGLCLALPRRILPLASIAVAGYAAATLVALLVSLNAALFGFSESASAPLLAPSIGVESAAILAGITAAVSHLRRREAAL